jgi:hypothetical protein
VILTCIFLWSCRESNRCSPTVPVTFDPAATYASAAAALSLVTTALIVAGNQRVLPRTVGLPSAIRPSAIASNVRPLARSAMIGRVTSIGKAVAAPSRSPHENVIVALGIEGCRDPGGRCLPIDPV